MSHAILVLTEQLKGQWSDITFELLGAGRALADALQLPLYALALGPEAAAQANQLGVADTVLVADDPQLNLPSAEVVAALAQQLIPAKNIGLVLVGGTNVSAGIGSLLAAKTKLPLVNFCREIRCEGGLARFTSQLFGGKILAGISLPENRGIVSLYPGAFRAEAGRSDKSATLEKVALTVPAAKVAFRKFIEPDATDVDITKQEVLVAVGRGIQSQDNLATAEELAQILNGAVCASRPVIDQGWLPLTRQVGKSGMIVKPRLYLALGISGAPEHWEGMQASQTIIAVNTDPKAPIFDFAHFGVCADVLDLMPALLERIKARKD